MSDDVNNPEATWRAWHETATKADLNFGPEIGRRIAVRRRELGMTQRALSDQYGYTREMIARIETGRSEVNAGDLPRLCVLLSVPLTYFFENLVVPDDDGPMARAIRRLSDGVPKGLSPTQQSLLDAVANLSPRDVHHLGVLAASMRDYDLLKRAEDVIEWGLAAERDREDAESLPGATG